jgi:hypothetical protein
MRPFEYVRADEVAAAVALVSADPQAGAAVDRDARFRRGNLITGIGRLLQNREVCRIRVTFEGAALGSELLASDALIAERPGVLIDTVPLPVRLFSSALAPRSNRSPSSLEISAGS